MKLRVHSTTLHLKLEVHLVGSRGSHARKTSYEQNLRCRLCKEEDLIRKRGVLLSMHSTYIPSSILEELKKGL